MSALFEPLSLRSGASLKNRFFLAPLTNLQSHADGVLSDEEYIWLTKRAEGGFGLVMTCAAHVQAEGQGFPGQLGIFDDKHLPGLTRLAAGLKAQGARAIVQLHHAGMRAPKELIHAQPLAPSDDAETAARAMTIEEVHAARDAFIAAAARAERAGFDGVELHGAHGYLICEFLSPELNRRDDAYGGALENRARLLEEIIDGVRAATRKDFTLGLRLSPERFGLKFFESLTLAEKYLSDPRLDFLDMSLWDVFKAPEEEAYKAKSLIAWFAELPRAGVRLGAAGKVTTAEDARRLLAAGADFVIVGTSAILHHDLPKRIEADPAFKPVATPVSVAYLQQEGLSAPFIDYLRGRKMVA